MRDCMGEDIWRGLLVSMREFARLMTSTALLISLWKRIHDHVEMWRKHITRLAIKQRPGPTSKKEILWFLSTLVREKTSKFHKCLYWDKVCQSSTHCLLKLWVLPNDLSYQETRSKLSSSMRHWLRFARLWWKALRFRFNAVSRWMATTQVWHGATSSTAGSSHHRTCQF